MVSNQVKPHNTPPFPPHLINEFAGICGGVVPSEKHKEAGLLAVLTPPSLCQRHDAACWISGDPNGLELRLGIWSRHVIQNHGCLRQQAPVVLSRHRREIVDVAPVIIKYAEPGVLEVESQVGVIVLKAAKLHACRRLNDGLSSTAQEHLHLLTVSCAKLLTGHHALDVLAVSEKHTALDRSQNNATVDTVVDGDGGRVVEHVDVAVLTVLDDKLLPVQFARQTAYCGIFDACHHVILRINLCKDKEEYFTGLGRHSS